MSANSAQSQNRRLSQQDLTESGDYTVDIDSIVAQERGGEDPQTDDREDIAVREVTGGLDPQTDVVDDTGSIDVKEALERTGAFFFNSRCSAIVRSQDHRTIAALLDYYDPDRGYLVKSRCVSAPLTKWDFIKLVSTALGVLYTIYESGSNSPQDVGNNFVGYGNDIASNVNTVVHPNNNNSVNASNSSAPNSINRVRILSRIGDYYPGGSDTVTNMVIISEIVAFSVLLLCIVQERISFTHEKCSSYWFGQAIQDAISAERPKEVFDTIFGAMKKRSRQSFHDFDNIKTKLAEMIFADDVKEETRGEILTSFEENFSDWHTKQLAIHASIISNPHAIAFAVLHGEPISESTVKDFCSQSCCKAESQSKIATLVHIFRADTSRLATDDEKFKSIINAYAITLNAICETDSNALSPCKKTRFANEEGEILLNEITALMGSYDEVITDQDLRKSLKSSKEFLERSLGKGNTQPGRSPSAAYVDIDDSRDREMSPA